MLDKYQNLLEQFDDADKNYWENLNRIDSAATEIQENVKRELDFFSNLDNEISEIDKEFYQKTGITNPKDMVFLWLGVGIQCIRWILIPSIDKETLTPSTDDRKDSGSEGRKDQTKTGKKIDQAYDKSERYPDNKEIMMLPVPFDAMDGTEDIIIPGVTEAGKRLGSKNHHSATMGHDPIIGQIFGTLNILTRSITFHDAFLTTRRVELLHGRTQRVTRNPYGISNMVTDSLETLKIDKKRLCTALLKENLHLLSDKNTKTGLPFPFLDAKTQQRLLNKKWNSKELENVIKGSSGIAKNVFVAELINAILEMLHDILYDESKDGSENLYSVRTRKIIAISNVIAESINVGVVATGTVIGVVSANPEEIKKSISHLDVGGMLVAIHKIVESKKLQESIRREFLEQKLEEKLCGSAYSFLGRSRYEEGRDL